MDETKTVMQAAFNTATIGVLNQGGPAMTPERACAYRVDGRKCAVGHLLSDEQIAEYNIKPQDLVARFNANLLTEIMPGVDASVTAAFLRALQSAHDDVALSILHQESFAKIFLERANAIATEYGLDPIETKVTQ